MTATHTVLVGPADVLESDCVVQVLAHAGIHATTEPTCPDAAALVAVDVPEPALPDTIARLRSRTPGKPLLLLTADVERAMPLARSAAADGILAWSSSGAAVVAAVQSLLRGRAAPAHHATGSRSAPTADPLRALTDRERDIVALLVQGRRNREIASSLGISQHTVRTHVQHVLSKLGVSHRHAAAALVRRSLSARRHAHALGHTTVDARTVVR